MKKTMHYALLGLALLIGAPSQAQTADEILNNYFENIGGKDKLKSIKGMKMSAKINSPGMAGGIRWGNPLEHQLHDHEGREERRGGHCQL